MSTNNTTINNTSPTSNKTSKKDECQNFKHVQYKTMLYNKTTLSNIVNTEENMNDLNRFLEKDAETNTEQNWNKLNKTNKFIKINDYVNTLSSKNLYDKNELELLMSFLKDCIDNKRLNKNSDVIYDIKTGTIKDIPALSFNKINKKFTLKSNENKHKSTLKSLTKQSS